MEHKAKTTSMLYASSKRKSSKPRHKNEAQAFEDVDMEERHVKETDSDQQRIQKIKITLGGKKSKQFKSNFVPEQDNRDDESTSDSSSYSSDSRVNGADGELLPIRKPIYWLEMRGIQPSPGMSEPRMRGGVMLPKKRGLPEEDEDYEVYPRKMMFSARNQRRAEDGMQQIRKPKGRYVRKEPPTYPAGSQEEQWYLEILNRGKVTCPSCRAVVRKTVEGLKKHMANCRQEPYTCQHCGKQLKSSAGMKYHVMADHNNMPLSADGDEQSERDRLRKVLKRLGKLKCSREGCSASFASIMGYMYHMKKCGKEASELEKMMLKCVHCGKPYNSKAGLDYHTRSEHAPASLTSTDGMSEKEGESCQDQIMGEKVQRRSAKVAAFHLQQIASEELAKEWPKRKVQQDLVPDDRKLKYTRPGMPTFSQEVLRKWNNEIKIYRKVQCPNKGCDSIYTSVSGLKAHLGCCHMGDFAGGTYRCLLCEKQFHSESGVKYHINSVHSQDWFVVNPKTTKSFEKQMKMAQKEDQWKKQKKRFVTRAIAVKKRPDNSLKNVPLKNNLRVRKERPQVVEISSESDGNSSSEEEPMFEKPKWNIKKPVAKVMIKTFRGRK